LAALDAENIELPVESSLDCYVVALGEKAIDYSVRIVHDLRKAGFSAEKDYLFRKIKAQFKAADRLEAKFVVILGEDELGRGAVNVKNMKTGEQEEIPLQHLTQYLKEKIS
jgi:histidyl-tRNA synthetase